MLNTHIYFAISPSPLISCLKIHTFLRSSWWILKFICSRFPNIGYGVGPGGSCLRIHCNFRNCINSRDTTRTVSITLRVTISFLIYKATLSLTNCYRQRIDPLYLALLLLPKKRCWSFCVCLSFPFYTLLSHPRELSVLIFKHILHHSIMLQLQIWQ